ncbi:MAG TPA: hypothetical protein VK973_16405 [Arenicellales bacterium]|nr:hypothetical protein [Arenicellales bacterium]
MERRPDPHKTTQRPLVIILAETRAYGLTFDRFKENVLDTLGADLALCVADNERECPSNPFYTHARYIWRYPEPSDWGTAFDYAQQVVGSDADWRRLLRIKNQWLGGVEDPEAHPGSAAILLFFRWFLKQQLVESGRLKHYDRYIVTRSDFMHEIPHVPLRLLSPNRIWIPDSEDYGGFTDRHIVASRRDILKVLSVCDDILVKPRTLYEQMRGHGRWNLEKYLKLSFARMGIASSVRRFPYTMYAVRERGGHTRWREGSYDDELGFYIKYPSEYARARSIAATVRSERDWTYPVLQYLRFRRCAEQAKTRSLDRLAGAKAVLRRRAAGAKRRIGERVRILQGGRPGPG